MQVSDGKDGLSATRISDNKSIKSGDRNNMRTVSTINDDRRSLTVCQLNTGLNL